MPLLAQLRTFGKKHLSRLLFSSIVFFSIIGTWYTLHKHQATGLQTAYIDDEVTTETQTPQPVLKLQTTGAKTVEVPILMYHYIEHVKDKRDTFRQKLDISPEVLANQLETLQQHHYTVLTMSELSSLLDGKKDIPEHPVILTFDDGYRDFYTDVFPLLQKYQTKATAYIVSGFIGRPNNMTLAQLTEVAQSPLVEIGAHTIHHGDLKLANQKTATTEVLGSKLQLEALLHIPVTTFAYPSGRYTPETIEIVKAAGFSTAVSTHPGEEASDQNRFTLLRLRPGSRTGESFLHFLSTHGAADTTANRRTAE